VTERIGTALGGAERWTHDFARWLVAHGHEVHVVCRADHRCQLPHGTVRHGIECGRSPLLFAAAAAARLDRLHCDVTHDMGSGWNCDVFQPHCGSRSAAILRNLQLMPRGLRGIAAAVQPLLPRYRTFAALCARQYAGTNRVFIAVSGMVASGFERFHGVGPEQIRVIHNGVNVEQFSPVIRDRLRSQARERFAFTDEDVVLLLVAHNLRLKGLPTLISGAAELKRRGVPVGLLIVGSERTTAYARLCRRLGLKVHFAGVVSDPLPYYAAADVCVHPTLYDPCSLVVLEAWACGLPVITSRFNGCVELMHNEFAEFVLSDPANPRELVQCLEPLLDRRFRHQTALRARRLAEAHPAEACFSQILNVYEEACSGRRVAA